MGNREYKDGGRSTLSLILVVGSREGQVSQGFTQRSHIGKMLSVSGVAEKEKVYGSALLHPFIATEVFCKYRA